MQIGWWLYGVFIASYNGIIWVFFNIKHVITDLCRLSTLPSLVVPPDEGLIW